jgi:hypothetical protein
MSAKAGNQQAAAMAAFLLGCRIGWGRLGPLFRQGMAALVCIDQSQFRECAGVIVKRELNGAGGQAAQRKTV